MPPKVEKCPADIVKRFKALNLHEKSTEEPDNSKRPFVQSATIHEEHKLALYGCAFNPYAEEEDIQYFATCGQKYIHVYKCPKDTNHIIPVWSCELPTEKAVRERCGRGEALFTVNWAYDTYEAGKNRNALKVVTAGSVGQIYVIDFVSRRLCNILRSGGSEVNDLRTSPVNSNIVASANTDMSIRIHHIRNESCLVVIGGPKCHQGTILTLDWHFTGNYLVSSGFDHQVMKWDLSSSSLQNHLKKACDLLSNGKQNLLVQINEGIEDKYLNDDYSIHRKVFETVFSDAVKVSKLDVETQELECIKDVLNNFSQNQNTVFPIYIPCGLASDVHDDYVDCIRLLPGTDYILSKSTGSDPFIRTWRFGPPLNQKVNEGVGPLLGANRCTTGLISREVPHGAPFFVRFAVDPRGRWLVSGAAQGNVHFYDLLNLKREQKPTMTIRCGNDSIRQVSFSTCGRFICTVDDQGIVCRFDRVADSVNPNELKKFP